MGAIKAFRLRQRARYGASPTTAASLPAAFLDIGAQSRLLGKVRQMGESFFTMSEEEYGKWLDALPQDEFFELIALE